MASGGWVFLDVREFGSKNAFGPGGSHGPGPSAPPPRSRLLALPARPWLPTLPASSFRRWGETSVRLFWIRLPAAAGKRATFSWLPASRRQDRGGAPRGWGGTQEAPPPCLRWGSRRRSSSACRLLSLSHGSSPKTETGELEGVPSPELRPWDRRGRRGSDLGLGARPTGEAPALPLMFPLLSLSGSWQLRPRGLGRLLRVPGPGLAAQQRPLAASPRHLGLGEG